MEASEVGSEAFALADCAVLLEERLCEEAFEDCGSEIGLRREVDVDRADRNTARRSDFSHGQGGDSFMRGDRVGLVNELLPIDHLFRHENPPPLR